MLPFFQANSFILGPLTIQVWGMLVSLGIVAGLLLSCHLAKKHFLSTNVLLDMAIWALIAGFIGGRLFFVWFYALDYFLNNHLDILKFWQGGASSLGGFFGAMIAIWIFAKKRHFSFKELLPYLDIGIVGLWLGWGIGRLGCFFIHDHPGRLSDFFLTVNFPDGARYDMGLYDSFLGFAIFIIFILLFKYLTRKKWGLVTVLSAGLYAMARFMLDFLRATDLPASDLRYFYLTPAQWGSIFVLAGILTLLLFWNKIVSTKEKTHGKFP